ncbi:MAG: hypothetical protein HKN29_00710 [Rhodothermales bacterium]|nr:hypothetical protein [Rhodothermales bacterium]
MRKSLILPLLFAIALPAAAQNHRALITDVSGTVTIARSNGTQANASWGMQLFDGDQVVTGADSKAALLYSDGSLVSLAANDRADVGESSSSAPTVDPTMLADVSDLTLQRTGVGELAALGGLRAGASAAVIDLTSPRQTRIRDGVPTFTWSAEAGFELFTVTVLSDAGEIWSGSTEANLLAYPSNAPTLEPGVTYFWRVEGEEMLDVTRSELVQFEVMAADDVESLKNAESSIREALSSPDSETSRDFLLGSLYARHGMNAEALDVFSRIAEGQGESAMLLEILGKLYYETGRKDLAVESLQRALELSRQ